MGIKRSHRDSLSSSEDPSSPYSREQSVDIKFVHLDADSAISDQPAVMRCSLPPHEPLAFASFDEYDVHYQKMHMNRCSECQKNFPDEHYMHLHIAEHHDPLNASKREKGEKTYACLLQECDRLCSTPQKRRLHCIDKHQFPRNYDFFIVKDGIDRRSSMLRPPHRRRSSAFNSTSSNAGSGTRRGESIASSVGENMDVVQDQQETHAYDQGKQEEGHHASESRRYPIQLRGRGGFGHGRGSDRGRGRRVSTGTATLATSSTAQSPTDPMDSLTSGMSALKFVPHSVRLAREKGQGRGG